jgi:hypothetical protein
MALGHHCIVYPKVKKEVEMAWKQMLRQLGIIESMRPE